MDKDEIQQYVESMFKQKVSDVVPDEILTQAQNLANNFMGEQKDMFKNVMSSLGLSDNDFWKGALVGAAAALVLSNEKVRKTLVNALINAGDSLKSAEEKVAETVKETASTATQVTKENVKSSSKIFRDTVKAGKQGFQQSLNEVRESKNNQKVDLVKTDDITTVTAEKVKKPRKPRTTKSSIATATAAPKRTRRKSATNIEDNEVKG